MSRKTGGEALGWTYFVANLASGGAIYGWRLSCTGRGVEYIVANSVNNFATGCTDRGWRSSQALRGKRESEATHRGQPTRTGLTTVYCSLSNRFGIRKV
jgi:hypothetical protein